MNRRLYHHHMVDTRRLADPAYREPDRLNSTLVLAYSSSVTRSRTQLVGGNNVRNR